MEVPIRSENTVQRAVNRPCYHDVESAELGARDEKGMKTTRVSLDTADFLPDNTVDLDLDSEEPAFVSRPRGVRQSDKPSHAECPKWIPVVPYAFYICRKALTTNARCSLTSRKHRANLIDSEWGLATVGDGVAVRAERY